MVVVEFVGVMVELPIRIGKVYGEAISHKPAPINRTPIVPTRARSSIILLLWVIS